MGLLRDYLEAMDALQYVQIDTSLARGLDYYTGMIFEAVIVGGEEAKLGLGSIAAGGRYDNLIGMFAKNQIPSAGGSLGIERIFNILEARAEKEKAIINPIDAVVGQIGSVSRTHIFKIASWLWERGLKTEVFYEDNQKVGEQIKIAANKGARYLIIAGEDELKEGQVLVRDLEQKSQTKIKFDKEDLLKAITKDSHIDR